VSARGRHRHRLDDEESDPTAGTCEVVGDTPLGEEPLRGGEPGGHRREDDAVSDVQFPDLNGLGERPKRSHRVAFRRLDVFFRHLRVTFCHFNVHKWSLDVQQ